MSFKDIGAIIRLIDGRANEEIMSNDMRGKSKSAQAMNLFLHGKRPVEVAIELDLSASEIEDMQQEYWVLTKLDELALVYMEIRNHLSLFLNLFHVMKINKMINEKDIKTILKYAAAGQRYSDGDNGRCALSVIMSYYGWSGRDDSQTGTTLLGTLIALRYAGIDKNLLIEMNDSGLSFNEIADWRQQILVIH